MAPGSSSTKDVWTFLTSTSTTASIAKAAALAVVTGGVTYWSTRPSDRESDRPPQPPPKGAKKAQQATLDDDPFKKVRFEEPPKSESDKPIPVAVFWDVDVSVNVSAPQKLDARAHLACPSSLPAQNCSPPTGSSGRQVVQSIRKHLSGIAIGSGSEQEKLGPSGPLMSFKAYLELSSAEGISPSQVNLRSELQGSGVSLIDTPKSGRKDVADKMIIADIMAFALDVPPPARIVLLSGDRDFAYPLSLIRGRGYQVVLIVPPIGAVPILKASANHVARWRQDVLGMDRDGFGRPYEQSTPTKALPRSSSPGPHKSASTPQRPSTPTPINASSTAAARALATNTQNDVQAITSALSGPGAPPVPSVFAPLVHALAELKREGYPRPLRSLVALRITVNDKNVYEKAGASSWRDYIAVAEAAGIVILGSAGKPGTEWVTLRSLEGFPPDRSANQNSSIASVIRLDSPNREQLITPTKQTAQISGLLHTSGHALARTSSSVTHENSLDTEIDLTQDSDDDSLAPPTIFKPFVLAMQKAEQRTQRYPPLASDVSDDLQRMISAGHVECPYPMQGVGKSFGTYITLAYKHRIAKLTPSEIPGSAALEISPAYSLWYNKLRTRVSKKGLSIDTKHVGIQAQSNQKDARLVNGIKLASDASNTVYKTPFLRGLTDSSSTDERRADKSSFSSKPSLSSPSAKKSVYETGHDLMLPHKPSGVKIPVLFFPLANALLFQRRDGQYYSTEKSLHTIVSKHKSVGHLYRDLHTFQQYVDRAEREGIVSIEPGFKEGSRHVRLTAALCNPKEKVNEDVEKFPVAGADPLDSGDISPLSSTASSLSRLARHQGASNSPPSPTFLAELTNIRRTPTVEDRLRFKPLMGTMISLRRKNSLRPSGTEFANALENRQTDGEGWKDANAKAAWFGAHHADTELDYCIQAHQFGFVVVTVAKSAWTVRLSDRYEALVATSEGGVSR